MYIGIDARKLSESICVTDDAGTIVGEYKMENIQERLYYREQLKLFFL